MGRFRVTGECRLLPNVVNSPSHSTDKMALTGEVGRGEASPGRGETSRDLLFSDCESLDSCLLGAWLGGLDEPSWSSTFMRRPG